jgi:hypothetical protein
MKFSKKFELLEKSIETSANIFELRNTEDFGRGIKTNAALQIQKLD